MTHSYKCETFLPYNSKSNIPITTTDDNKTITNDSKYNFTAYGSNIIEFSNYFSKDYVWSLKINTFNTNSMVFIGIDEETAKNTSKPYALQDNTTNYAYAEHKESDTGCIYSCNEIISNKVKQFGVGDIITMSLNTSKLTLKYELNNKFIYQISNIDDNKEYRLAIYVQRASVTIDDFNITKTVLFDESKKHETRKPHWRKRAHSDRTKSLANLNLTHDSASNNLFFAKYDTLKKWQKKYINLQTEIHGLKMQRRQINWEHSNENKLLNLQLQESKSIITKEQTKSFLLERDVGILNDQLNNQLTLVKQLSNTHGSEKDSSIEERLKEKQRILDDLKIKINNINYNYNNYNINDTKYKQLIEGLQTKLDNINKENNKYEQLIEERDAINMELRTELDNINKENNKYGQLIKERDAINMELRTELDNINKENNKYEQLILEIKNENNDIKARKNKEINKYEQLIKERDAINMELRTELDNINKEKESNGCRMRIVCGIILFLLCIIIGLYHHQIKLNQQLYYNNNMHDNYKIQIQQLNNDLSDFNLKQNELLFSYSKLKVENKNITNTLVQLENDKKKVKYEYNQLKYENKNITNTLVQLKYENKKLKFEYNQLKYENDELTNSNSCVVIDSFDWTMQWNQLQTGQHKLDADLIHIDAQLDELDELNELDELDQFNTNTSCLIKDYLLNTPQTHNFCEINEILNTPQTHNIYEINETLNTPQTHNMCEINETSNNLFIEEFDYKPLDVVNNIYNKINNEENIYMQNELFELTRNCTFAKNECNLLEHNMNLLHIKYKQLKHKNKGNVNMLEQLKRKLAMSIIATLVFVIVFFTQHAYSPKQQQETYDLINNDEQIEQQSVLADENKKLYDTNQELMTRNNVLNDKIGNMEKEKEINNKENKKLKDKISIENELKAKNNKENVQLKHKISNLENELKATNNKENIQLKHKISNLENELKEMLLINEENKKLKDNISNTENELKEKQNNDSDYGQIAVDIAVGGTIGCVAYRVLKTASQFLSRKSLRLS